MGEFARNFFELAYNDPFFRIVIIATVALIAIVGLFAVLAILLRIRHNRLQHRRKRLEVKWEAILLDVFAGNAGLDSLAESVSPRDRIFYLDLMYRFGRHLHGQELEVVRDAAKPFLNEIATNLDQHDTETRAKYLQMLGVLGFRDHHEIILESLDDRSPMVAMVAARALMRRGRHEYAPDVLERFARFEDWSESTLSSLLAVMGPGASPALRDVFADEQKALWIRVTAGRALEKLNDFESANVAADVIDRKPEAPLLCASLDLLGQVGRDEHIPLVRSFTESEDDIVRISAIGALGRLSPSSDTEALLLSISDESPWVAMHAARSLKHLARADLLRDLASSGHRRAELLAQVLLEP